MAGSLCHAIARHVADSGHMLKLLRARKMCSRSRKRLKGGQWTVDTRYIPCVVESLCIQSDSGKTT